MAFTWDRSLFDKIKVPKNTELDLNKFEEGIEKVIIDAKYEKAFKTKKSFSPSSFSGQGSCPSYWTFAFRGAEFEFAPDALGIFAMTFGTNYGDSLEKQLVSSGFALENQTKITNSDPPIFGLTDFVGEIDGIPYVTDIKTVDADKWNKIKTTGKAPAGNMVQILIYMRILKYRNGILLFVNRDSGKMLSLPIVISEKNKAFVEYLFNWMKETYEWANSDEIPSRGFTKSTWVCKSCPVKEVCWSLDIPKKVGPGKLEIDVDKFWEKYSQEENDADNV